MEAEFSGEEEPSAEAQKVKLETRIKKWVTYTYCLTGGGHQLRDPRAGFGRTKSAATQLNDAPGGKFEP